MIINKNHKNTTQFSWATPYAANACISECSNKFGTSVLQASSALLTKQENFVEKPSLRLKKPFSSPLETLCYPEFVEFASPYNHATYPDRVFTAKPGFSDCALLALQEALNGLGWAWKVYFLKPKMSQTAQGAALTKYNRGFLGFC